MNSQIKSKLGIVIVNFNAGNFLKRCLESILNAKKNAFYLEEVAVVDNASTDDSWCFAENINLPMKLIKNEQNIGFGAACNQGALSMLSKVDYVLFLNPDCEVFSDTIEKTINVMNANPLVGVCGPQIVNSSGEVTKTCGRTSTFLDLILTTLGIKRSTQDFSFDHTYSKSVDHLMGCYYLISAKLYKYLNGFDERFFVYWEDSDLSFRVLKTGMILYFFHDAKLKHYGGGCSEQVKAYRLAYSTRSRYIYIKKYFGLSRARVFLVLTVLVEFPLRCIKELLKLNFKGFLEVTKAYGLFLRKKLY